MDRPFEGPYRWFPAFVHSPTACVALPFWVWTLVPLSCPTTQNVLTTRQPRVTFAGVNLSGRISRESRTRAICTCRAHLHDEQPLAERCGIRRGARGDQQLLTGNGNENWEFIANGLMRLPIASINDLPIKESERRYYWPLGRRPDDHPSLSVSDFERPVEVAGVLAARWSSPN